MCVVFFARNICAVYQKDNKALTSYLGCTMLVFYFVRAEKQNHVVWTCLQHVWNSQCAWCRVLLLSWIWLPLLQMEPFNLACPLLQIDAICMGKIILFPICLTLWLLLLFPFHVTVTLFCVTFLYVCIAAWCKISALLHGKNKVIIQTLGCRFVTDGMK